MRNLFLTALAATLLQTSLVHAQGPEDPHPSEALEPLLLKWNESISSHNLKQLTAYYADTIQFYGGKKSAEDAVKSKEGALAKSPSFKQSVSDVIYRTHEDGIEVSFKKVCTENEKSNTYSSYLIMDIESLRILAESDLATDVVMARKAKAETLRDGKHCFEMQGTIWPVDAEPAPYASRYELILKKGNVTGAGEYYSWAMRSYYSLEIKGKVQSDQLLQLNVDATGPTYPDNEDDKFSWTENRKFSKGKLLFVEGEGVTEPQLREVDCGK